jgi:hypothetical protein
MDGNENIGMVSMEALLSRMLELGQAGALRAGHTNT